MLKYISHHLKSSAAIHIIHRLGTTQLRMLFVPLVGTPIESEERRLMKRAESEDSKGSTKEKSSKSRNTRDSKEKRENGKQKRKKKSKTSKTICWTPSIKNETSLWCVLWGPLKKKQIIFLYFQYYRITSFLTCAIMELSIQHTSFTSHKLNELSHCHTRGESMGVHDLKNKKGCKKQ